MKLIVDITGYGNSGKTAISDYIKDFNNVFSFPNYVEFELFRVAGGLVDLYYALYADWGLIRSNYALRNFEKLTKRIGTTALMKNVFTHAKGSGHNYDNLFNGNFLRITDQYIKSLKSLEYISFWPYQYFYHSGSTMMYRKIRRRLGMYDDSERIVLTEKSKFLDLTRKYLDDLFQTVGTENQNIILLNNAFDMNGEAALNLVSNGLSIIVDRDPRDIYASTLGGNDGYVPEIEKKIKNNLEIKRKFLGTDEIDTFVKRFKILRENENPRNHKKAIRIRYEDFVTKHDEYAEKLNALVGLDLRNRNPNPKFNPNNSIKNVGIWKKYADRSEIKLIEKELDKYCYQ